MSRVYILLVNWNGWADTVECLESVFRLDYPDFRVIVCDNASSDGSLEQIKAWAGGNLLGSRGGPPALQHLTSPPVKKPLSWVELDRTSAETGGSLSLDPQLTLIKNEGNLGFAGGNNVALRYVLARGDAGHIWLLNNDTVVDGGALSALVSRIQSVPGAGMCGSTLLFYERPDVVQALGGGYYLPWFAVAWHVGQRRKFVPNDRPERVERWLSYINGASLLVSVNFVREVGLMCEDYFLYFEELDWTLRAGRRFSLAYAPASLAYHKVGRAIGTRSHPGHKSLTCDFYNLRNRLVFSRKFFPWSLPTVRIGLGFEALARLCFGHPRRARMALRFMMSGRTLPSLEGFERAI